MKLLYCQVCGDIIAPNPENNTPRFCRCGKHAVWWVNSFTGVLRLYEKDGVYDPPNPDYVGGPENQPVWQRKSIPPKAFVLGLHNDFLRYPDYHSARSIRKIIDECPPSYMFKGMDSVIIRIYPGQSNDTDLGAVSSTWPRMKTRTKIIRAKKRKDAMVKKISIALLKAKVHPLAADAIAGDLYLYGVRVVEKKNARVEVP